MGEAKRKKDATGSTYINLVTDFDRNTGLIRTTAEIGYMQMQFILDTRQGQVRDALIEMGWTPPVGENIHRIN